MGYSCYSAYQLISLSAYQLISLSAYQLISLSAYHTIDNPRPILANECSLLFGFMV
jgi:hypothetical protein